MADWLPLLSAVLLIIIANGAPIVAARLLGSHAAWPVDAELHLGDGRPLFGPSKTWRGVVAALMSGALFAPVAGLSITQGSIVALLAMIGDLLSSFLKRRQGIASSGRFLFLDQVPESLLPLLYLSVPLSLTAPGILIGVALFFVIDLFLSRLLFQLSIRKQPY